MIPFDNIPVHIHKRVYRDIGEVSMCWEKLEGAGVFDSTKPAEIGLTFCQFILDQIEGAKKK